jgi:hypothetical protein
MAKKKILTPAQKLAQRGGRALLKKRGRGYFRKLQKKSCLAKKRKMSALLKPKK